MIRKTLSVGFENLKHIHHFADIHIRNLKRHTEYRQVFQKVYSKVKENKDNSIIVLAGDIVHAKLDMSPELIDLTSDFFTKLSKIAPLIIIPGNHDCNLNNRYRMDALQPIVNALSNPKIHYLTKSGEYIVADTSLVLFSVFDDPSKYPKAKDIKAKTKIAMFHGSVEKSQTDLGFRLFNCDLNTTAFKGYDISLLGDIHKRQFLDLKKTIGYPGSLMQQNHGEDLIKGYLQWDVVKRKAVFKRVINDFGYYTLDIVKGKYKKYDNMPYKPRLRIRINETTQAEVETIVAEIKKTRKVADFTVTRMDTLSSMKSGDRGLGIDIGDIRNPRFQNELIVDYLKRNYFLDKEMLIRVKKINKDLQAQLQPLDVSRNINWRPKRFEFSNMFSYGPNNVIDFTNLRGVVGVFAPNAAGKSSLLDALAFCLFDKSSRTWRAANVMNNKKSTFNCKLTFDIGGVDYYIERKAKKDKNGNVRVDVNFVTTDDTGNEVSLNGEQRRETNQIIRSYLGDFEDFILTALSLQNNNTAFIDKSQSERKDLLAQFLDINVFEELYLLASDTVSDMESLLKEFKKTDLTVQLAEAEIEVESIGKKYSKQKKEKSEVDGISKKLNSQIISLAKKTVDIDLDIQDIGALNKNRAELEVKISRSNTEMVNLQKIENKNKEEYSSIKKKLHEFAHSEIEKKHDIVVELKETKRYYSGEIEKLKIDVSHKLEKLRKLDNFDYDEACLFCVKNAQIFAIDVFNTKKELNSDKVLATKYINKATEVKDELSFYDYVKEEFEQYKIIISRLDALKTKHVNLKSQLSDLTYINRGYTESLEKIENKILQYNKSREIIKENKELEETIELIQSELDTVNSELGELEISLLDLHGRSKIYETQRKNILDTISKAKELEEEYRAYEYYLDAIKRDGVPYELISKVIPHLEAKINDILSQIVEFNMVLETDGKHINGYIVYDEDNIWPLELTSGMEKFIASLAIRTALVSVSSLPRPNFMAIDEGFGNLDADNLNSMFMLFDYLKLQFDFLLIITHIDTMRDVVDSLIEIKNVGGYSNINF